MAEVIITKENFQSEVLESKVPVLIDFWAEWCGPCRMMSPIISQIAEEHPEIKVCKVNVDEQQELSEEHNVLSIPSFVVYKNGKPAGATVGYQPKDNLLKLING